MLASLSPLQIQVAAHEPESSDKPAATRAPLNRGAAVLYRNIIVVLVPALACLVFDSPLLVVGLVLLPIIFCVRWLALASPFPRTRVNIIVLVFLLAVLWSMWRAPDLHRTVLTVARIVGGVALLYVIVDYAHHPGRLWNVAAALVAAGAVAAFLAPFITASSPDKFVDVTALFRPGFMGLEQSNPNMIAGALAALLPLALALVLSREEPAEQAVPDSGTAEPAKKNGSARRLIGAVALAPMVIMLLLLQTRGAWLAALGGAFIFLFLFRSWLIALVPLTLLLVALVNNYSNDIRAMLPFQVNDLQFTLGLEGRQAVWEFAAVEVVREPLGHGINTFRLYADNAGGDLLTLPQRLHAHNLFLQAGFETGLVGLAAFAALFGYALYASGHAVARRVKHDLAGGVFAALCAVLLSALLEANMWGNKSAFVLWGLLGMAVVLGRYGARRRHRQRVRSL